METISAHHYPVTPQTQMSHVRQQRAAAAVKPSAGLAQQATRSMQAADDSTTPQQPLSAPASQESFTSTVQSSASSDLQPVQSASSNASQLTDGTSVTSSAPSQSWDTPLGPGKMHGERTITPSEDAVQNGQVLSKYALASPMSVSSPGYANGAKRTASGHVKNAMSLSDIPMSTPKARHHSRGDSMSSTGSRAGELAHNLRARLSYAMAKVQNGWEHRTFDEVEQLATQRTPNNRYSMPQLGNNRANGFGNHLAMREAYANGTNESGAPPSKRHSGAYQSYVTSPPQPQQSLHSAPRLQPPADIRSNIPKPIHTGHSRQTSNYSTAMSPPRTPMSGIHRPGTLRTDTQTAEAERDALQALFQLGSPHASQVSRQTASASQASSAQGSPLKAEFPTPRRVTFAQHGSRSPSDRSMSNSLENN